jgi:hypothetical protein
MTDHRRRSLRLLLRRVSLATVLAGALAAGGFVSPPAVAGEALKLGFPAPEIAGGPWIGSPPLTTAGLRGRVTLVEFWTFG